MFYKDNIKIMRLEDKNSLFFDKICEWNYHWWGVRDGKSYEQVRCNLEHSLNINRLPMTYIAIIDEEAVGMYQFAMSDDLESRPDIYPWLINVFVDEKYRGIGVCRKLMNSVHEYAKAANIQELYLYTKHIGLYEKFGWEYVEDVFTFREDSPVERLYRLNVKR